MEYYFEIHTEAFANSVTRFKIEASNYDEAIEKSKNFFYNPDLDNDIYHETTLEDVVLNEEGSRLWNIALDDKMINII